MEEASKKASHDKLVSNGRKYGILVGGEGKEVQEGNPMVKDVLSEYIKRRNSTKETEGDE